MHTARKEIKKNQNVTNNIHDLVTVRKKIETYFNLVALIGSLIIIKKRA